MQLVCGGCHYSAYCVNHSIIQNQIRSSFASLRRTPAGCRQRGYQCLHNALFGRYYIWCIGRTGRNHLRCGGSEYVGFQIRRCGYGIFGACGYDFRTMETDKNRACRYLVCDIPLVVKRIYGYRLACKTASKQLFLYYASIHCFTHCSCVHF